MTISLPEVTVDQSLRPRLLQGHPWIYRNHVRGGEKLRSGQWVRARCGALSVYGLWDAQSAIAVRVYSRQSAPDPAWLSERVWEAWEGRAALRDTAPALATSAYRWIYGEGDGLPGLTVDRYGDYAVLQTYAESVQVIVPTVASALRACDPELRGIVARDSRFATGDASFEMRDATDQPQAEAEPQTRAVHDSSARSAQRESRSANLLGGELPPTDLVVQEHGLYFHADLLAGQKTGLFLDQRENRRAIEGLAGGRRVLNCFAYTGGFSLYALRGGAAAVLSADIGRGLAEAAAANIALNRLDARRHEFVTADCFALLDAYAKAGRRFELVILDPPSFARTKSSYHAALRAYTRINALALRCVEPGGLLASASCTSQVGPEQFRAMLAEAAAQAGRRLQVIHEAGQPLDHPVPVGFPEGRYLKFLIARVHEIA